MHVWCGLETVESRTEPERTTALRTSHAAIYMRVSCFPDTDGGHLNARGSAFFKSEWNIASRYRLKQICRKNAPPACLRMRECLKSDFAYPLLQEIFSLIVGSISGTCGLAIAPSRSMDRLMPAQSPEAGVEERIDATAS